MGGAVATFDGVDDEIDKGFRVLSFFCDISSLWMGLNRFLNSYVKDG